jgi:histidinol-phosphate aminotransferase
MASSSLQSLALPQVARLHAYTPGIQPGESGWVKLNTNECPYAPSPRVVQAVIREMGDDGASLRLYPNPQSTPLRRVVARLHGLSEEQVCIGNGSDDILNLIVRCFCSSEVPLGHTFPSYSLYPVLVEIQDGRLETVPFERSMQLPVERIAASKAHAFILTSPNAPTGVAFSNSDILRILSSFKGLLVVDEAYAPFARENAAGLIQDNPRLLVVRTLSKAYALAGMRVGYVLGHPEVIDLIDRVRDSYNVNRLSQVAAIAALEDQTYYDGVIARVKATRDRFQEDLRSRRGWFCYPSQSNFVFVEPRDVHGVTGAAVAKSLYDFLCANKVLVRYFPSHALTAPFLRISVGTDEEMLVLNRKIDAWQKAAPTA